MGLHTPTRILDPRFMIAVVEEEVLRRCTRTSCPSTSRDRLRGAARRASGSPARCFDGTEVLFPPGTRIAGGRRTGNWILLDADGSPPAFRMPKNGYYFDDSRSTAATASTRGSSARSPTSPTSSCEILADYAPALYAEHRLCAPGLGRSASASWA